MSPRPGALSMGLSRGSVSSASVAVRRVRDRPVGPIARFSNAFRAKYPTGSSVFYYGMYLVQDGLDYATFPRSSALTRDGSGLHIYNDIAATSSTFSTMATIVLVEDCGEAVVSPHHSPSAFLRRQIESGGARFVTTIGLASSSSRQSSSDYEEDDPGGDSGDDSGEQLAYSGPDEITSSHNQCTSGGENIGISYTVPSGYASNVTVTQCVDNGTTNECFSFTNQAPGSKHNVSIWIPGNGAPSISMGVVSHSGVQEGVGWTSLGGC
jgi:hypothetical protein